MQHEGVHGIDRVFVDLQPVALGDHAARVVSVGVELDPAALQDIEAGKRRHPVRRSHIGKHQPAIFAYRIPRLTHLVLVVIRGRLAGLVETISLHIIEPAVIAAADAIGLQTAIFQRRATVTAMRVEQTGAAAGIAKYHQILLEDLDALGQIAKLGGQRHRLPVASQQFPHRRPEPHMGEKRIFVWNGGGSSVSSAFKVFHGSRIWRVGVLSTGPACPGANMR